MPRGIFLYTMRVDLFELLYRYVYPAIRKRLAEILYYDEKMKQEEIARILGVSQSAVSRYIEGQRGSAIDIASISYVNEKLRELAKRISRKSVDEYTVQVELVRLSLAILARKELCRFHASIDPSIDYTRCNICPIAFSHYIL